MENISRPSIRTYLILMNLILLLFLFPTSFLFLLHKEAKNQEIELEHDLTKIRENSKKRRATLAKNMALSASQAVAGYDFTFLNILVDQVVKDDSEIIYCIAMTKDNIAIAHSDHQKIGSRLENETDKQIFLFLKNHIKNQNKSTQKNSVIFIENAHISSHPEYPVTEAFSPIYNGDKIWGVIRLGFTTKSIKDEIQIARAHWLRKINQYKYYLITTICVFMVIGIIVAGLFTRLLVRPVRILSQGVQRISDGDLEHSIGEKGLIFHEFTQLSNAFNLMQKKLKDSYSKLEDYNRFLENKVEERTRELEEAQNNLLQQAHEAGMAEMSVGIIHNIGNAITPAKASTSLLAKKLNNSPLKNGFHSAAENIMIAIETSDTLDPEEKDRLSQIIRLLPQSITEEYSDIVDEIYKIQETHEHIESIIHLQMQYGSFGDNEKVNINHLIEDALKLLKDSITKRNIHIKKNFSDMPQIYIQKTKLIQILVNLIKNSIESIDECNENRRQIILTTQIDDTPPRHVELIVRDTGIGFSKDEKEKLFRFGYSTKKKGSGFGLHSCANYLIANNGSISASSRGKGKGAEFAIRLPIE